MLRRILCLAIIPIATLSLLATPAGAHPRSDRHTDHYYLALGDSLAYGYQPTHVRGEGYVDQLYAHLRERSRHLALTNLGCPGETTGSMRDGGICTYPGAGSQLDAALAFLRAHRDQVDLVTIDIGANDVNRCASGGTIDISCVTQALGAVGTNLRSILAELRAAAPRARTIGMTYYNPYLAAWLNGPSGQQLALDSAVLSAAFNGTLTTTYAFAGVRVADVAGAFSSYDFVTQVNGVPLAVARICQWTWMCTPPPLGPDIHANKAGYAVIARAFEKALQPVRPRGVILRGSAADGSPGM